MPSSYLSLRVHRRVPVRVVKDHGVRPGEVDSKPAGASRQNEAEQLRVQVEPFEADKQPTGRVDGHNRVG